MLFSKSVLIAATAALTGLVSGQSTTSSSSPQASVHVVVVGDSNGAQRFNPETLTASPGDFVQFHFYPKNHSVVQSSFTDPCSPIVSNTTGGFFSGFMPVSIDSTSMPVFTIPVNTTDPIWFYCATGSHCQNGMAGVINPPDESTGRTLAAYKSAAAQTTTEIPNVSEGEGGTVSNGTDVGGSAGIGGNSTSPPSTETGTGENSANVVKGSVSAFVISAIVAVVVAGLF